MFFFRLIQQSVLPSLSATSERVCCRRFRIRDPAAKLGFTNACRKGNLESWLVLIGRLSRDAARANLKSRRAPGLGRNHLTGSCKREYLSTSPRTKSPFCRGRLLHLDEDATLLSVLRVALGDNESLLRFASETWRSRRRPVPCLFSHHRRKRSSGARAEEARDSGLELVRGTPTWPTVQHTRAAWATLATTFFWQLEATGTRVTVPCSWKVEVGIPDLRVHVKNFQQKKNRPTARKNLSHISRSRDLFLFQCVWPYQLLSPERGGLAWVRQYSILKESSRQRPRSAMSWKSLEKSGLEPAAPNRLADRKHWAL